MSTYINVKLILKNNFSRNVSLLCTVTVEYSFVLTVPDSIDTSSCSLRVDAFKSRGVPGCHRVTPADTKW